jgi:hypothetical protein
MKQLAGAFAIPAADGNVTHRHQTMITREALSLTLLAPRTAATSPQPMRHTSVFVELSETRVNFIQLPALAVASDRFRHGRISSGLVSSIHVLPIANLHDGDN